MENVARASWGVHKDEHEDTMKALRRFKEYHPNAATIIADIEAALDADYEKRMEESRSTHAAWLGQSK